MRPGALLFVLILASIASCQDDQLRLAAQLDDQGKCEEAETYYRQALDKGPPSTALLNNFGNHYLI